jgi:hypothetical protein
LMCSLARDDENISATAAPPSSLLLLFGCSIFSSSVTLPYYII